MISAEMNSFFNQLIFDYFSFLPRENFWISYNILKDKITSYFEDFPIEYSRMTDIPDEFLVQQAAFNRTLSVSSKISSSQNENDSSEESNKNEIIQEEKDDDLYDVIPVITPDNKVVRIIVKFDKEESGDLNKEKTKKIVEDIESGKMDYKSLPKEQLILYDNQEENNKALKFLKISRQSMEERKFTENTFKIQTILRAKAENIDFKEIFQSFEALKDVKYSATLLLKHSDCVFIIKSLREFTLKKSSAKIKKVISEMQLEAKKLYIYFKNFFPFLPKAKNFWKEYNECKVKFEECLSEMTHDDKTFVTDLPAGLIKYYQ